MARVTYGSIITDIKGSIGGITFQHNANAKIARLRFTKAKKNTQKQITKITEFQTVLSLWQTLDGTEKAAWNAFAATYTKEDKWGNVKTLSGFQYFNSINNYLLLISESMITAPPTWSTPLVVQDYTAVAIFNDFSINWSPSFAHTSEYLLLFTSPLLRTVSLANRKVLRLTSIIVPGTDSSYDYLSDWQAAHNIPVPIAGSPSKKFIFTAVMSVHETKGLVSALNTNYAEYEPT
jgi:hypothetical protein